MMYTNVRDHSQAADGLPNAMQSIFFKTVSHYTKFIKRQTLYLLQQPKYLV